MTVSYTGYPTDITKTLKKGAVLLAFIRVWHPSLNQDVESTVEVRVTKVGPKFITVRYLPLSRHEKPRRFHRDTWLPEVDYGVQTFLVTKEGQAKRQAAKKALAPTAEA